MMENKDPRIKNVLEEAKTNKFANKKKQFVFTNPKAFYAALGEKDPLKKEMEDCLKESLEPIFIHSIEKSGHLVHLEKPLQLAKLLRKVLL